MPVPTAMARGQGSESEKDEVGVMKDEDTRDHLAPAATQGVDTYLVTTDGSP